MLSLVQKRRNDASDAYIKLLATENLTVIRHNKPSAFIDLKARTIHVPAWDFAKLDCKEAEDVMNCHEVFHALYTSTEHKVDAVLNIVEDNRIERLGKMQYPGLKKIFMEGYRQLNEVLDFFKIKNMTVAQLNDLRFLDRLNLVSKLGSQLGIEFTVAEKVFVDRCNSTQTSDEVLQLAEDIRKFIKDENKKELDNPQGMMNNPSEDDGPASDEDDNMSMPEFPKSGDESDIADEGNTTDSNSGSDTTETEEDKPNEDDEKSNSPNAGTEDEPVDEDLYRSDTIEAFDKAADAMLDAADNVHTALVGQMNKEFLKKIDTVSLAALQQTIISPPRGRVADSIEQNKEALNVIRAAEKAAAVLHKEFMLRKNAKERLLDKVESTGKLNLDRIHMYKLTENIFKTRTNVFTGENHGFVFLVDCSGSMQGSMMNSTLQQMFMIVEFCRKMGIKYKVYFYSAGGSNVEIGSSIPEFTSGDVALMKLNSEFGRVQTPALIHALDYTQRTTAHKRACELIYTTFTQRYSPVYEYYANLKIYGGTCTTGAIMAIEHDAREFFDANRIEKRNLVVMTDGSSGDSLRFKKIDVSITNKKKDSYHYIDALTKVTYKRNSSNSDTTDIAMNMMKHRLNCNTILIRLSHSFGDGVSSDVVRRGFTKLINFTDGYSYRESVKNINTVFSKARFMESKDHPLIDSVFIIKMDKSLSEMDMDEVTENAVNKSAAQIANKVINATKTERVSRVLMQSLAEAFN